jgi:hypothetical protein
METLFIFERVPNNNTQVFYLKGLFHDVSLSKKDFLLAKKNPKPFYFQLK